VVSRSIWFGLSFAANLSKAFTLILNCKEYHEILIQKDYIIIYKRVKN